ncbi:sensory transduction protein kinase [Vibrio nigripulchritudo ATCC 27043]|uniref:bifunctional diguanylate cyclase/phosphodiesterase n=1 Tax=Vibrio nigripulchritudo TaxID=28173 RepID=UPI00021C154D|nr:EAL domain-containing protein [Vibrio nigripulchritudo]EGU54433.1 sensory transduction protein kinase [Vibrio nigripulchritudo ATCC 27043]
MADLKRNIWTLYKLLLLISSTIFLFIAWQQWLKVERSHSQEQFNAVQIFTNGITSLLNNQEMVLDVLGDRLLSENNYESDDASQEWLDRLLSINNSIAAFGLADPYGEIHLVSSNLSKFTQPNLLHKESTRESFAKTLTSYSMVLGRTYYKEDIDEFILPIRKAIRDESGNVLAVMTAGLQLDQTTLFNIRLHDNYEHKIGVIRDDYFVQFMTTPERNGIDYNTPISERYFDNMLNSVAKSNGYTLKDLKKVESPTVGYVLDQQKPGLYAIQYIPRFDIWTVSEIDLRHVVFEYLGVMAVYIAIFLAIQAVFFLFVRSIDKHEKDRHDELLFQANHDPLTQLPNRHYLRSHIHRWLRPTAPPFSILFMDMDHFKNVNDSSGHDHGDKVLEEIAARLRSISDDQTLLIRESGDEFIIVTSLSDHYELNRFANNIIHNLSKPYEIDQFSFILGCSIGIAQYPEHGTSLDTLLRCADIAMYDAKTRRNSVSFFTESMQSSYLHTVKLEQRLRQAIQQSKLYMVYQPQFNAEGNLHGVEALVRWNDDELGFVPPDKFIPIAESCGLMPTLGQLIIDTTLAEMSQLQRQLGYDFQVSINISVRQITQEDFLDKLILSIQTQRFNQHNITLEITENLFIEDIDIVRPVCENLNRLGVRISLDDFGTGYSSLSMLGELPFQEIKIDKGFIDNILTCTKSLKMAQNIIAIGKNFDMQVLAEGVETEKHEAVLKRCGCDLFQGYYYARPMAMEELYQFAESTGHTQSTAAIA